MGIKLVVFDVTGHYAGHHASCTVFVVVEAASSYELSLDGDCVIFFMIVVVLAAKVKSFLFIFGCYNIMLLLLRFP